MTSKDDPLSLKVTKDLLIIQVGLNVLKRAVELCPKFYDYDKHRDYGRDDSYVEVEDINELASDIIGEMQSEEEDGSTPLTDFLDEMIFRAYEQGSTGFADED